MKWLISLLFSVSFASAADVVASWDSSPRFVDSLQRAQRVEIWDRFVWDWLPLPYTSELVGDRAQSGFTPVGVTAMIRVVRRWAPGQELTFFWNPSPSADVTEYVLYGRTSIQQYELARVPVGTHQVTVRLNPDTEVFIVVAVADGEESVRSNQVLTPDPEVPTNFVLKLKTAGPLSEPGGAVFPDRPRLPWAGQRRSIAPSRP